jgi:hypothetical protein
VARSYASAHDEVPRLLREIAKRADAGETRRVEYGEVTVLVIEKSGQFLDLLSVGSKAMPKARQDEQRPYRPTRAEMRLLPRLATTWRQFIDPSDWSLRIVAPGRIVTDKVPLTYESLRDSSTLSHAPPTVGIHQRDLRG